MTARFLKHVLSIEGREALKRFQLRPIDEVMISGHQIITARLPTTLPSENLTWKCKQSKSCCNCQVRGVSATQGHPPGCHGHALSTAAVACAPMDSSDSRAVRSCVQHAACRFSPTEHLTHLGMLCLLLSERNQVQHCCRWGQRTPRLTRHACRAFGSQISIQSMQMSSHDLCLPA